MSAIDPDFVYCDPDFVYCDSDFVYCDHAYTVTKLTVLNKLNLRKDKNFIILEREKFQICTNEKCKL